ncbi:MAG: DUF4445 domain-containing protein, partial [Candidatus Electrothrix sp. ATG2]|nr:DUF4445 domain-containing protein [Candidatus Electrothrix sp. ATG2]
YIRKDPYICPVTHFPIWSAKEAGLKACTAAPVYSLPCVAGFLGADIVAGVLTAGMHRRKSISLFMDIGTNGEIVIGNNEWLVSASCSAGPCFEGGVIRHGMRATDGAIEGFTLNPDSLEPEYEVIGNSPPLGICGSGMLDTVTELFLHGLINLGQVPFSVQRGDRIAQLLLAPVYQAQLQQVQELGETDRGAGGFGHTGL